MSTSLDDWIKRKEMQRAVLEKWAGDEREARRVGGGQRCEHCGFLYYDHPNDGPGDHNGEQFLNRLCDGRLVKL